MSQKPTQSQIQILADYYTGWYEVPDAWTDGLIRYGQGRKYPLLKVIRCHAGIISTNYEKKLLNAI